MIFGITGTDGAGKGTVVDYLVQHKNFFHCSARAIWMKIFEERQMEPSRSNMRLVGNEMRTMYGNDFLVTHYLEKIKNEDIANVVIESIRTIDEAKTLKANAGVLIAVDAHSNLRYERVKQRRSSSDQVSYEQFLAHEDLESRDPDPHGMQKRAVIEMADFTIQNNGSLDELHTKVDTVLAELAR